MRVKVKSILFRSILIGIFFSLLITALVAILTFYYEYNLRSTEIALKYQPKAQMLRYEIDTCINGSNDLSVNKVNNLLLAAEHLSIGDMSIFSADGKPVVHMEKNKVVAKSGPDIIERLKFSKLQKDSLERKKIHYQVGIKNQEIAFFISFPYLTKKTGMVAFKLQAPEAKEAISVAYLHTIIAGSVALFIQLLFTGLFTWKYILPVCKLNRGVRQIAQGKVDKRIGIVRDDEIGEAASSVNEIAVVLQHLRDEVKGVNPLTEIEGKIAIEQYINNALFQNSLIYVYICDISHFKAYNDKYGFEKGDEVILFTRDCIKESLQVASLQDSFIGHEGGDDFVVVTQDENWEKTAKIITTTFDKGINRFYNSADARNGFIETVDRKGESRKFPIMTMSIAIISNKNRPFSRYAEITQVAQEVQQYVKSKEGSFYAFDRRTGPVGSREVRNATT